MPWTPARRLSGIGHRQEGSPVLWKDALRGAWGESSRGRLGQEPISERAGHHETVRAVRGLIASLRCVVSLHLRGDDAPPHPRRERSLHAHAGSDLSDRRGGL